MMNLTVSNDDAIKQWMLFIDGKSKDVMEMPAAKNKDIGNAFDVLKIISNDKKARMAYEAREAELMDQRTRIKSAFTKGKDEGKAEGKVEGKAEIILALLSRGMGVEEVASIAGMDIIGVIEIQKGFSTKG
jgi:predicted transposase/invertase (TIGR01784 family)